MKKLFLSIFIIICFAHLAAAQKTFTPDLSLLSTYEDISNLQEKSSAIPYLSVYKKNGKTLIYVAASHRNDDTLKTAAYAFENYDPDVILLELDRDANLDALAEKCSGMETDYAVAVAIERGIPIVLADLDRPARAALLRQINPDVDKLQLAEEVIETGRNHEAKYGTPATVESEFKKYMIFQKGLPPVTVQEFKVWFFNNFKEDFDRAKLNVFFGPDWRSPSSTGTVFQRYVIQRDYYARDPFMLKNIAAALNKYDTVFAMFGGMHHIYHQKVLEKMMGYPVFYIKHTFIDGPSECKNGAVRPEVLVKPNFNGYNVR